jgi:hypothetical protein
VNDDRRGLSWIVAGGTASLLLSAGIVLFFLSSCRQGTEPEAGNVLFEDDFESGLSSWVGRPPAGAELVPDPLGTKGVVVRFTRTIANGDIFSSPIAVDADRTYVLSFDYLGVRAGTVPPGGLGGFIGISDVALGGPLAWIAGTQPDQVANILTDDGAWHSYELTFVPSNYINVSGGAIHIILEDFEGSGV